MTQDTRKDRRVKIVSLNVRYKSATVDEFIENHAHDVSRGGIFIKTGNPFPPGTLLKFEIRLASDQAVIAGVGRIVWKRDAGASTGDRPAGMGVKFIKIDEPSKVVIDRLMNTRVDAGKAFEANDEIAAAAPEGAAARTAPPTRARTPVPGTVPASGPPRAGPPRSKTPMAGMPAQGAVAKGAGALPTPAAGTPLVRKATMMGLGVGVGTPVPAGPSHPPAAGSPPRSPFPAAPSVPPRPGGTAAGAAMFPKTESEKEMPPKEEQTVMRQAAELLEDALREAGGSMAEVGTNPLFSGAAGSPGAGGAATPALQTPATPASEWTTAETPHALAATVAAIREESTAHEDTAKRKTESLGATVQPPTSARPAAVQARVSERVSEPAPSPKKRGSGGWLAVAVLAAAAVGGVFMFRDKLFGASASPEPVAAPTVSVVTPPPAPPPAPAETAAAPPSTASAQAAASVAAAPSSVPSATAAPSSTVAAAATRTAEATAKPTPVAPAPRSRAVPKPTTPATAAETATGAPAETATATAAPTAAAPTETATAAPAPAPAKPTPAPKPAKPAKPSDDNPY